MVGWILLALLGVIVLTFFIPVRISVEYVEEWRVRMWLFGIIPVYSFSSSDQKKPTSKKTKKMTEKTAKDKPSVGKELQSLFREEGISGVMHFFSKLIGLLKTTLSSLARYITVRRLALCVRVGGEEADEIATTYGKLSAALAVGFTTLSQLIRIRKPCVRVVPDFLSDHTEARLRMALRIWPFGIIGVGIAAVFRLAMLWMKTIQKPVQTVNQTDSK